MITDIRTQTYMDVICLVFVLACPVAQLPVASVSSQDGL